MATWLTKPVPSAVSALVAIEAVILAASPPLVAAGLDRFIDLSWSARDAWVAGGIGSCLLVILFLCLGQYGASAARGGTLRGVRRAIGLAAGAGAFACLGALIPALWPCGWVAILAGGIACALVAARRWLFGLWIAPRLPRERVLILGTGDCARRTAEELADARDLGIEVAGFLGEADEATEETDRVLGSASDLLACVRAHSIDRIVVVAQEQRERLPMRALLACKLRGVRIEDAGPCLERLTGRIPIEALRPASVVFSPGFRTRPWSMALKREIDIAGAAIGLIAASPVIVACAALIKLTSRGPVFFIHTRVGKNGARFRMIKFRTMRMAEPGEARDGWANPVDDRITAVGRILRRFRLDELPQLWNILRGDMSLVGPRPDAIAVAEVLGAEIPHYWLRTTVRPGLTGWAQIRAGYVASLAQGRIRHEFDLCYLKDRSLLLDLWILLRTAFSLCNCAGAR